MRHLAPARLAAAALGAAALLAVLLGVLVLQPGVLTGLDAAADGIVAPYRSSWLLAAFLWFTTLGTGAALFGIAMTATGFLWAGRRACLAVPLWVAFAGAQASVWALKYAVGRPRPAFIAGVAAAVSPSFPSAHAAGSIATLGFVAYAMARNLPARRSRVAAALWTAAVVALIDFSRVFLGAHFATDVLGGVLLGGAWLLLGLAIAGRWESLKGAPGRSDLAS